MKWACKFGFHKYNVPDYNDSPFLSERTCSRCGKKQHEVICGRMCKKWIDGPKPIMRETTRKQLEIPAK